MQKYTENTDTENKVHLESELAEWLDSFHGYLHSFKKAQPILHNAILSLDSQDYTPAEMEVLSTFLNSALSLSFVVKANDKAVLKFINYNR